MANVEHNTKIVMKKHRSKPATDGLLVPVTSASGASDNCSDVGTVTVNGCAGRYGGPPRIRHCKGLTGNRLATARSLAAL